MCVVLSPRVWGLFVTQQWIADTNPSILLGGDTMNG